MPRPRRLLGSVGRVRARPSMCSEFGASPVPWGVPEADRVRAASGEGGEGRRREGIGEEGGGARTFSGRGLRPPRGEAPAVPGCVCTGLHAAVRGVCVCGVCGFVDERVVRVVFRAGPAKHKISSVAKCVGERDIHDISRVLVVGASRRIAATTAAAGLCLFPRRVAACTTLPAKRGGGGVGVARGVD